jgi:hypothetical protein
LAANLTSPTNEFAAVAPSTSSTDKERSHSGGDQIDKKDDKGGSIMGLRLDVVLFQNYYFSKFFEIIFIFPKISKLFIFEIFRNYYYFCLKIFIGY